MRVAAREYGRLIQPPTPTQPCCVPHCRRLTRPRYCAPDVQIRTPSPLWEQPPCNVIDRLSKVSRNGFVLSPSPQCNISRSSSRLFFFLSPQGIFHTNARLLARTSRVRRAQPNSKIHVSSLNQSETHTRPSMCPRSSRTSLYFIFICFWHV